MEKHIGIVRNTFLLIGIVALGAMVYSIGIEEIIANLKRTGIWFFAIIIIWLLVYIINACSWGVILKEELKDNKVSFMSVLRLTISGYAINYSTPVGLAGGEPYRIMELSRYVGGHKATSSVVLYAMMHIVSHFLLWLFSIVLIVALVPLSIELSIVLMSIFLFCMVLIMLFFRGYKRGLLLKLSYWACKIPFAKTKIKRYVDSHHENIKQIDTQISDLYLNRKKSFFTSLFLEFCGRIVSCAEIFVIFYSIGKTIGYLECIILFSLSSLIANLVAIVPMQLGVREGGYFLALRVIQMTGSQGVYVGLITRIRETFWILLGMILVKFGPKHD